MALFKLLSKKFHRLARLQIRIRLLNPCGRNIEMRASNMNNSVSVVLLPLSFSDIIHLSHRFSQDIYELKDQIQDVEGRYMQGLKEMKVLLHCRVEVW